jgi:8-oxo-dGTP pyrophosphatase MutT (NUDIX family)
LIERIRALVTGHEKCFDRDCLPGHITGSSWIVSHDLRQVLLTHHRKLGGWLQLGGHADGQTCVFDVALREAREESGMQHFRVIGPVEDAAVPFDIDIHIIPARKGEPAHEHHDIRYLLVAEPGQELVISDESIDLRWFPIRSLPEMLDDESMIRMHAKATSLLARG